jgi:hypothetical protein
MINTLGTPLLREKPRQELERDMLELSWEFVAAEPRSDAAQRLRALNAQMDRDPQRLMRLARANAQRLIGKPNL